MSVAIRRALYGRMAADGTLTGQLGTPAPGKSQAIYHALAPSKARFPYVIFFKSAGTPVYSMEAPGAAYDNELWTIKGVDRSSDADVVDQIASRLDVLVTDGALSISGASQMFLARESDVEYSETADGTEYKHAGALYRLLYT